MSAFFVTGNPSNSIEDTNQIFTHRVGNSGILGQIEQTNFHIPPFEERAQYV